MSNRRMAYLAFIFVCILAFVVRQNYFSNRWRRYNDRATGIALEYPASWFKISFYHCSTCHYIKLFVMDIPVIDQMELRVYTAKKNDAHIQKGKSFGEWIVRENSKNVHILNRRESNVGKAGYYGEEIAYEDKLFRGRVVTLHHHGQVYAIEIHAIKKKWNEASTVFDKILETFEFLE